MAALSHVDQEVLQLPPIGPNCLHDTSNRSTSQVQGAIDNSESPSVVQAPVSCELYVIQELELDADPNTAVDDDDDDDIVAEKKKIYVPKRTLQDMYKEVDERKAQGKTRFG
eukprot:TRINITY_DN6183_c0_g1_i2.p1 TRINITY_DN6183_c0_g1~~TRINITY_DN6183_c0_g1_i2.p1  ORF type:complete len:112 (-),score=22.99 TRINITY_DN6183_c0_g1_i2:60-395(-)